MKKRDKTMFSKPIEAIIPTYDEQGKNICQVVYSDGETVSQTISATSFLRKWLFILRIDLYTVRMWAADVLDHRNLNPIVISEKLIFIPVKIRKPVSPKDGSYGYVRLNKIESIESDYILLSNGKQIPYLSSYPTLRRKIQLGRLLGYTYRDQVKFQRMVYQMDEGRAPWDPSDYKQ